MKIIAIIFPLLIITTPLAFAESPNAGTIYWKQDVVSSNSLIVANGSIVLIIFCEPSL